MIISVFRPLFKFRHKGCLPLKLIERQNHLNINALPPEVANAFNCQINMEFFASFTYLSMAAHFGRQDVSLPGCHKYFLDQVQDEREHAQKLIDYLLRRGNVLTLLPIQPPATQCWKSPLLAFKEALQLEKTVSSKLLQLRKTSEEAGDLCACLLIENEFLDNQIEETDTLSRHVVELEKIGPNEAGIYLFDRYLLTKTDK